MSQMSDLNKWKELAAKQLRGKPLESFCPDSNPL